MAPDRPTVPPRLPDRVGGLRPGDRAHRRRRAARLGIALRRPTHPGPVQRPGLVLPAATRLHQPRPAPASGAPAGAGPQPPDGRPDELRPAAAALAWPDRTRSRHAALS